MLPEVSRDLVLFLCRFLADMAAHAETTLMDASNLALVWAPNFFAVAEGIDPMAAVARSQREKNFVRLLITACSDEANDGSRGGGAGGD